MIFYVQLTRAAGSEHNISKELTSAVRYSPAIKKPVRAAAIQPEGWEKAPQSERPQLPLFILHEAFLLRFLYPLL